MATALDQLRVRFPFHIAGIHSDNGSEFINHHLLRWATLNQISFSRGRASHSNDQAHVEQKNWTIVRRNIGYYRYDDLPRLTRVRITLQLSQPLVQQLLHPLR